MGDWPSTLMPAPKIISPFSPDSLGGNYGMTQILTAPASRTLVQNQAYFFPFTLEVGVTAVKMVALIGATANGNIDVGIYDSQFTYLISSGATGQGSINTLQEFDITDTALPPGNYWMAASLSSATGTIFALSNNDELVIPSLPTLIQTSAHPLPTTVATAVKSTDASPSNGLMIGVSFDTLI